MGADNHWSGRVTITPPLSWHKVKLSIATEDVKFDIHEEDRPLGRTLTAVAIVPARESDAWGPHTGQELQALIDAHPRHEFEGSLKVSWDDVYGSDMLAERWTVQGRTVVHEKARRVWQADGAPDPDAALAEARDLAKALYDLFGPMPFCVDDLDERLSIERLPQWIGGEADTWQRDGGE